MPYIIKKTSNNKYLVCKKSNPNKCFSKKGLLLETAKKQLKAIQVN